MKIVLLYDSYINDHDIDNDDDSHDDDNDDDNDSDDDDVILISSQITYQ